MNKLAVFDLDGTLADTLADLAGAVNHALSSHGLLAYPVDDYRRFVGNGVDNLIRTTMADHYTPALAEDVKAAFTAYYAQHYLDATAAYPGIGEMLSRLQADGVLTAVISNKPHAYVPDILRALYPGHPFAYAWGQQQDIARKPAPDALERLLSLCGVDRSEALYVGDSDVDVVFAHAAGVRCCGVSWGFRGAGELRDAGADTIVHTAEELYHAIRGQDEQA